MCAFLGGKSGSRPGKKFYRHMDATLPGMHARFAKIAGNKAAARVTFKNRVNQFSFKPFSA